MKDSEQAKKIDKLVRPLYGVLVIGLLCLLLAGILSFRTFMNVRHEPYPIPRQTNATSIQGWMTVRYISRTYHIPEAILKQKLSLTTEKETNQSLDKLAKQKSKDSQTLINEVETIIKDSYPQKRVPTQQP